MAEVIYNDKIVSDANVRRILETIRDLYQRDVYVTSGDRSQVPKGGSKKSLHLQKRAADFGVSGQTLEQVFRDLKRYIAMIFDATESYEVIYHGSQTATGGPHLHLGHYLRGKGVGFVDFKTEGLTAKTKGAYSVRRLLIPRAEPVIHA